MTHIPPFSPADEVSARDALGLAAQETLEAFDRLALRGAIALTRARIAWLEEVRSALSPRKRAKR